MIIIAGMTKNKSSCDLNTCMMCKCCIKDWMPAIAAQKKTIAVKKGHKIFTEGEPVSRIYFVYLGIIKVHKRWDEEKDLVIRFARQGDILGHLGLGSDPIYPVTATAIEPALICSIDLDFFESTLSVNPGFTYALMKLFANEVQESEKRMRNLVHMPVKERIALALLNLKKQFGLNAQGAIDIELTRQDLSSFAAVSYETLFKVINEFLKLGLIGIEGKNFKILDEKALFAITVFDK
jgi:CRP/FNR family transcriptional regulator